MPGRTSRMVSFMAFNALLNRLNSADLLVKGARMVSIVSHTLAAADIVDGEYLSTVDVPKMQQSLSGAQTKLSSRTDAWEFPSSSWWMQHKH